MTVLIVPLAQCVLAYVWFRQLARQSRHRLMVAIEVLAAWQYAEVYFLPMLVASW